ncbi:unnamed protein product [Adineta steineri]|uniref:Potassium transport system protein kup n=1 Tax=Adineta steineri TaxID=433720 RepID=A0A814P748_9BILA|nr:unnamed protein product [Adineta steineri]CAF3504835.1 unnamed protein product [Adineta steineri]
MNVTCFDNYGLTNENNNLNETSSNQKAIQSNNCDNVKKKKCSLLMTISLTFHSLGIIFGDIGTSPLYVLETIFHKKKTPPNQFQCIGAISLIIWSLILVVSIKYSIFILKADNKGEGGTFALCALLTKKSANLSNRMKSFVNIASILAASLLIGDGALTPAVSVLSAVEGLALNAPNLHKWVVPITVLIIICLFLGQQWGTSKIGNTFAPVMVIWFLSLFLIGIWRIRLKPIILKSFNPYQAIIYLIKEKKDGFYHIGGVFLSVTGCEALYADLGHFGLWPVRISWFFVVFPCVITNYLGQGALLIHNPQSIENPFYRSVPEWAHWPMVILSTIATIIASQAIITGCFSLLSQASSLGFCAPLQVHHTSKKVIGQIYVPTINWVLMLLTLFVTIYFQSSSRLTNAYGLTVCSVSVITTILFLMLIKTVWKKSIIYVILFSLFLILDCLFWAANAMKFIEGAWIAILIALIFFLIGYSWYYGEKKLKTYMRIQSTTCQLNQLPRRFGLTTQRQKSIFISNNQHFDIQYTVDDNDSDIIDDDDDDNKNHLNILTHVPLSTISNEIELNNLENSREISVTPGVACFLTCSSRQTPDIFENYIRLFRNIPQLIIFLRIQYARVPFISRDKRLLIKLYGNIYYISATFGYGETKKKCVFNDILLLSKELYQLPIPLIENQITFFLPNQIILISKKGYKSWITRWPLYLYSIQKRLVQKELINIQINTKNTIQIAIIAEL